MAMRGALRTCLVGVLARTAIALTIGPSNTTFQTSALALTSSSSGDGTPLAPVIPLTDQASADISPMGLSGSIFLVNATSVLLADSRDIATINCDEIPGDLQADYLFREAINLNATAVLFYSRTSETCTLEEYTGSYPWIYTMRSRDDTDRLLDAKEDADEGREELYAQIAFSDMAGNGSNSGSRDLGSHAGERAGDDGVNDDDDDQGQDNALGPSPSTAVAMIILYSITGIITALFLTIIVTGAVRAHRHPERYGPRNVMGRPRQSRAKGIARAMLDTLPIVKTGQRNEATKPADIELAQPRSGSGEARDTVETEPGTTVKTTDSTPQTNAPENATTDTAPLPRQSTAEDGIAAALPGARRASQTDDSNNTGCSICTEDFKPGQDQRVLPCDHRFHPECVDPWLLNVSGTCPLCRIDLHPPPEYDENGNEIQRDVDDDGMAPPLGGDSVQRMSIRRSIIYGLIGPRRPERMTREERLDALRQWRQRQMREASAGDAAPAAQEDEGRNRRRLRTLFGVRTNRTEPETRQDGAQS